MPDTAPSVELTAPNGVKYTQPTGLFINNEFVRASQGGKLVSIDPATEEEITRVESATDVDVDCAVKAARAALSNPEWRDMCSLQRGQLLARLANMVSENKELFATIEAWDNGKPYHDALEGDVPEVISVFQYFSGWADKSHGQSITTIPGKFVYTVREPVGVVGQIIPWNYPLSMAAWKLGPALACANTVVLKPAEQTPLSALLLARLVREAGFPPGVVNVLPGLGREAGAPLTKHPGVDKVAFTGSTATARQVMMACAPTLKKLTVESGGKSPLIVFRDADMDQAIKYSHLGIMSNQGQICTATSRILVDRMRYDHFVDRFVDRTKRVGKMGSQWDAATYQGPQVSRAQFERVVGHLRDGESAGARPVLGGAAAVRRDAKGFFVPATVFADVKTDMSIWTEEIFGPVVCVAPFDSEEEAIELANASCYGLGAAVFTSDLARAHRVARAIESGMVWINSSQDADPRVPFGGVKQSGIGRELGEDGLRPYFTTKSVFVNLETGDGGE